MGDVSALARRTTMVRAVAFVGASEIVAKLGLVFAMLIVARRLGAEQFGQWSYAVAVTGVIALAGEAGLTNALQRRIARGDANDDALIANALGMKLAASALAFGLVGVAAVPGRDGAGAALCMLTLGLFAIATTSSQMIQGIFRAKAASHLDAVSRAGQQVVLIAAVLAGAVVSSSLATFGVAYAVAGIVGFALSTWILGRRAVATRPRFDGSVWRDLAHDAWPFWIAGMLWIAYFRIDVVILSQLSSDEQTGLYNMAYSGFQVLTLPSAILAAALFPSLAHLHKTDRARFGMLRSRAQALCMAAGAAIAFAAAAVAGPAIQVVAGEEYAGSVLLFRVLALGLVFLYPNYALFQALSAAGHQRLVMVAAGIGACTNVTLNLLMIPTLDALGAGIATVSTEALVLGTLTVMSWRALRDKAPIAISPAPAPGRIGHAEAPTSSGQRAA
jgi:O-antigen/teichoic acid export membrane protein